VVLAIGSGCEVVLGILALLLVPLVLETSELTAFAVVETLLLLVPLIGAEFGGTKGIVELCRACEDVTPCDLPYGNDTTLRMTRNFAHVSSILFDILPLDFQP